MCSLNYKIIVILNYVYIKNYVPSFLGDKKHDGKTPIDKRRSEKAPIGKRRSEKVPIGKRHPEKVPIKKEVLVKYYKGSGL